MPTITLDEKLKLFEEGLRKKFQDPDDEDWILEMIEEFRQEEAEKEEEENVTVLICDGCECELTLVEAGLQAVPEGDWYCSDCAAERAERATRLSRSNRTALASNTPTPKQSANTTPTAVSSTPGSKSSKKTNVTINETPVTDDLLPVSDVAASAKTASMPNSNPNPNRTVYAPIFDVKVASSMPIATACVMKSPLKSLPPAAIKATPAAIKATPAAIKATPKENLKRIRSPPSVVTSSKKKTQQHTPSPNDHSKHMSQQTMWAFLKICNPVADGETIDLTVKTP